MITHLKVDNIHSASQADRSFDEDTYVGFQVGSDGVHAEYFVTIGAVTYYVGLGETLILPNGGERGKAVITPVRKVLMQAEYSLFASDDANTWVSSAHVIAMTCPTELRIDPAPKLRRIHRKFTASSGATLVAAETHALILPYAGRSHGRIRLGSGLDSFAIYGGIYDTDSLVGLTPSVDAEVPERRVPLQADTALTADAGYKIVDENFDVIVVKFGDGTTAAGVVDVEMY